MPTGYTAPVQDGTVTEFVDFALTCARGFGAMIMLRDSDQSLAATKRLIAEGKYLDDSTYYANELEQQRQRLAELHAMTDDEARAAARAEYERAEARNREIEEKRQAELARYERMLALVEEWEPPTSDHVAFKEFMVDQLRSSIDFDCRPFEMPLPDVLTWHAEEIARTERRIVRCEEELAAQRERNQHRRAWVEALLSSLPASGPVAGGGRSDAGGDGSERV